MDKKVKLIITDLDQTFLRTDKSISQFSLDVIKECKEQGINIAIATARSEKAAKKYIDLINPDIIISNGGALVKHKDDIVYKCLLSASISDRLIKDCILNPNVGEVTVETENDYYWNGEDLCESDNDYSYAIYNNYDKPLNCETYKITVEIFEKNTAAELAAKYSECNFLAFSGEKWHRFAHKDATKDYAINKLLQYLHIDSEQVAAFGDDYNDIDMLKTCGYGVAVSNAITEVLEIATHVTDSNDNDGVAKFIKQNFLIMSEKHSIEGLKGIAQKLISNNHSSEYIIEFKMLEDKELNKKYDVYYIRTDKNKYILKKSKVGYEANIYEAFFNNKNLAVPKYYGRVKDSDNNVWFLLEYIDGKVFSNESLESYCNAATELALMHSSFLNIKIDKQEYLFVRNENELIIDNVNKIIEKHINDELNCTKDILQALKSITERLRKRPKTILQNDLLPMNIMIKDEKIKFIDWEFAAIGCYTHDIGRLLSDFRDNNGVNWVKSEWEQDILNAYFTAISNNGLKGLSREEFLLDYQCSRLINYAKIVFAHILNDWELTDWYKLNFNSMVDIINKLESGI